jgi:hypothetical protein
MFGNKYNRFSSTIILQTVGAFLGTQHEEQLKTMSQDYIEPHVPAVHFKVNILTYNV